MSLVVTFNGQFKPYNPQKVTNNHRLQRMSQVAPVFNDLLHKYIDKETLEKQEEHDSHEQQLDPVKQSNMKAYDKVSKSMKRRLYARDIMTKNVKVLGPDNTINDALQMIGQYQFHHIPIVEEEFMKGIVSDRLILKSLADGKSLDTRLEDIMIVRILTAQTHTSISDIARAMLMEKISSLPVTDSKLNVKGILTTSDILSLLISSFPVELYG